MPAPCEGGAFESAPRKGRHVLFPKKISEKDLINDRCLTSAATDAATAGEKRGRLPMVQH